MGAHLTTADFQMADHISLKVTVPNELGQKRLDQVAAELFQEYSRSRLQSWIKDGQLKVDGQPRKIKEKLVGGEVLTIDAELLPEGEWLAQDIPLDIVHEDEHIVVINKPAGLVVHPAAGNPDGTVLNAMLFHYPEVVNLPRAGIVHRLDKDTSGLMVIARTLEAQNSLVQQLQSREMGREYEAICMGVLTGGASIDEPIARHSTNRLKMAVHPSGKDAVTHYRVLQRFQSHTHIRVKLETGRTHQIRVHMAYIQHPLVGDPLYGGRMRLPKQCGPDLMDALKHFDRQALHAKALQLVHPQSQEILQWEVELPADFEQLLVVLREDHQQLGGDW